MCVLMSAVIKVAQKVPRKKVKTLYRGVGMRCNPKYFWSPLSARVPSEKCLISTTKDQKLAIKFSALWKLKFGEQKKKWPTIFEIDTGAMELGADITSFSQYPGAKLLTLFFSPQLLPESLCKILLNV